MPGLLCAFTACGAAAAPIANAVVHQYQMVFLFPFLFFPSRLLMLFVSLVIVQVPFSQLKGDADHLQE